MAKFEDGCYGSLKGIALIAKVLAGRCKMHYTRVAVGKGVIPEDMTPKTMTEPAEYVMDAVISSVTNPVDGECQVSVQINSANVETGFYATGLLLYAEDPDEGEVPYTYLVLEGEPEWIRPASSIVGKLAFFDIIAAVGDIDKVSATIDPDALVTHEELELRIQEHNKENHPETELVTLDHQLGTYPQVLAFAYQYGAGMGEAGGGPAGGTSLMQLPAKAECLDKNRLAVYTTKDAARPETVKEVRQISRGEYVVLYQDSELDAVYLKLLYDGGGSVPDAPADMVAVKNMVFSADPPGDTSVIWGAL
ncbi:hypothetical protein [Anaerotruncus sp. 1XD42-93]|uniref:hypothetical protein n=1 Tax=Anaerotruncus sp. 1XD42-93 TaxID=2320853 RepID=UPI000EA203C0|nr:hypothetical protein [Anaerotruncus sp. 1XD42-93]NBK19784.1 hypothetical protein [Anaerotruncus sp. 1XD42-93]NCE76141.1 hypothetical protein [Anaerotruncus sp. X29]RKJ77667.1 hypothetical protein D7Y41_30520 [Anaerotruncus sp. 1XD22-93]